MILCQERGNNNIGICDVWPECQWDYAKLRREHEGEGDGEDQRDMGRTGLCVRRSGCVQTLASHQACLTQPWASQTPGWSVFSFNPVLPLHAPPHSVSLASAVGMRGQLLDKVRVDLRSETSSWGCRYPRQVAWTAYSEHRESRGGSWGKAAHTAWDTAWGCWGYLYHLRNCWVGVSICINCC